MASSLVSIKPPSALPGGQIYCRRGVSFAVALHRDCLAAARGHSVFLLDSPEGRPGSASGQDDRPDSNQFAACITSRPCFLISSAPTRRKQYPLASRTPMPSGKLFGSRLKVLESTRIPRQGCLVRGTEP